MSKININNRLTNDSYKKPKLTFTDKLTDEDIEKKLEDYVLIKDVESLKVGNLIRYFQKNKDSKEYEFRLGGSITNIDNIPTYIVLGSTTKSGYKTWSVQLKDIIIYKKITIEELQIQYKDILKKKELQIKGLIENLKELTEENKLLTVENKKLNNKIKKLTK